MKYVILFLVSQSVFASEVIIPQKCDVKIECKVEKDGKCLEAEIHVKKSCSIQIKDADSIQRK